MNSNQGGNNQEMEYYKQLYLQEKQRSEQLSQKNAKIINELNHLKQSNQNLQNQLNANNHHRVTFTEALNMHLANSILGNQNNNGEDSNIDLGKIISTKKRKN